MWSAGARLRAPPVPRLRVRAARPVLLQRAWLLLLLFDGAIRFLGQALRALGREDRAGFAAAVGRANGVIGELAATLDQERGGEVAANLARLYEFMLRHLTQGLAGRSRGYLDGVLEVLRTLRAGFEDAIEATRVRRA